MLFCVTGIPETLHDGAHRSIDVRPLLSDESTFTVELHQDLPRMFVGSRSECTRTHHSLVACELPRIRCCSWSLGSQQDFTVEKPETEHMVHANVPPGRTNSEQ